ncbi:hypothetical protein AVEN_136432-1 [Araneus ventricosus]|uniref:Uncharacterized protein n=1 Tax=Araneus ventricosus TaxID=182803 RepID=A0A4Y2RRM3_ARAVE|nr:hypothetical protein AVEN_136432-1 [Araneus ventricosus]
MGITMQEDDTITQHAKSLRRMASRLTSDYFLFSKLKEHLSVTRFSSDTEVKTTSEIWLNGKGRDFYHAGLKKLVLRSDICLNRFDDCVEKRSACMPLISLLYFLSNVNK